MRGRPAAGGEALSPPEAIDPALPPPRRLLRGGERLAGLVGGRLLVGITYLDDAGRVTAARQFCGRVAEVGGGVVVVDLPDGDRAVLPADASAYEPAGRGSYRLESTGETVVDPDFVTTWRVLSHPA